jgi:hypothetical protein
MNKPSLSLIRKATVHSLHGQSIASGMGSPSGPQIGTKVRIVETVLMRTTAAFAQGFCNALTEGCSSRQLAGKARFSLVC